MGITISFENDTECDFKVTLRLRGSAISVGQSIVNRGTTWSKTDSGISASMSYSVLLEDLTSPLIFTGDKYETPKWVAIVSAPAAKGERRYRISELTSDPPPDQSKLSLPQGEADEEKDDNQLSRPAAEQNEEADAAISAFRNMEEKLMSEMKKEDHYWNGQQIGLTALANRAASARDTFKGLSEFVMTDMKIELAKARSLASAHEIADGEYGTMKLACEEFCRVRAGQAEASRVLAENVLKKAHNSLKSQELNMGKLKAKALGPVDASVASIMSVRDKCLNEFTEYRKTKEDSVLRDQNEASESSSSSTSKDPYMCLRRYMKSVNELHNVQASYPQKVVQAANSVREADMKSTKELQGTLISMLAAQKAYYIQRVQSIEALTKAVEDINVEEDHKLFGKELAWIEIGETAKVCIVEFEPKPIGLVFRNRVVIEVVKGSQAEMKGVNLGWQILAIDGKRSPPDHRTIEVLLRKLLQAGRKIKIKFGKNLGKSEPFYRQPPPERENKNVENLLQSEVIHTGQLQYFQRGLFGGWGECQGVVTKRGKLHIFKSGKTLAKASLIVSINLKMSRITTGETMEEFIVVEQQSGMLFGSKEVSHRVKSGNDAEWKVNINKYAKPEPNTAPEEATVSAVEKAAK